MADEKKGLSRRRFAKGLALAPLGLAGAKELLGQAATAGQAQGATNGVGTGMWASDMDPKPDAKRRWQIYEEEFFARPLVFERSDVAPEVEPFALREVALAEDGPYAQSRAWSRGFMLRIGVDRLTHNFKLTAGIPSNAVPLGEIGRAHV